MASLPSHHSRSFLPVKNQTQTLSLRKFANIKPNPINYHIPWWSKVMEILFYILQNTCSCLTLLWPAFWLINCIMGAIKTDVLYKSLGVFVGNQDINHVISSKIREICIARPTIPLDMGLPAAFPFTKSKDSLFQ